MKLLKRFALSTAALLVIPLGAYAGTVTVTSGPTFSPATAFSSNTIKVNPASGSFVKLAGSVTIIPPSSNIASIAISGNYMADSGDLASASYTFTIDSTVLGNTTYTINGSAAVLGVPQNFSSGGAVLPGKNVYRGQVKSPGSVSFPVSGTFTATLTINFNTSANAETSAAVSPALGSLALNVGEVDFAVAPAALTPPPAALQENISTRTDVGSGDKVLIGGFIITGNAPKKVAIRALGPSLPIKPATILLANPVLELHKPNGAVVINDNWQQNSTADRTTLTNAGIAPKNALESALVQTLAPGSYTAIVHGIGASTGIAAVEVYDLNTAAASQLANISTRGYVAGGDDVMIGGFILGPSGNGVTSIIVRALGPSLASHNLANTLPDPMLELHNADGDTIASNDNWMNGPDAKTISDKGLAPKSPAESALVALLGPGNTTAIVRGVNGATGIGQVEIYNVQK